MVPKKKLPTEKALLHPRNKHRERYNFAQLIKSCPALAPFVLLNKYNDKSINFFDPAAVKMLNKALLKHFYKITEWDIPANYLCPPIPGRADYLHYVADLLATNNHQKIPKGPQIKCLDIGVGANCIYPIIGHQEYGWLFVGSDIDRAAIAAANQIITQNASLAGSIELRLQTDPKNIFAGIIKAGEQFDATICNPPFHASLAEAQAGTVRKLNNLTGQKNAKPTLNFAGKNNELWCEGGEERFIKTMIIQSKQYAQSCRWFTTLVAKSEHLPNIYKTLKQAAATSIKTIPMGQGNKISRIVAWTFES